MSNNAIKHSTSWINFSMGSFAVAAAMMAGGIFFLEASFAAKGFYEDAKTEKLLMDINNTEE